MIQEQINSFKRFVKITKKKIDSKDIGVVAYLCTVFWFLYLP